MKCIYHWLIDACNVGRCQKCGRVRDFARLLRKESGKKKVTKLLSNQAVKTWKRGRKPRKRGEAK